MAWRKPSSDTVARRNTKTPAAMLGRAAAALESGLMPEDVRAWLLSGLQRYRAGYGNLDYCLRLRPLPGKRSAAHDALYAERDELIGQLVTGIWPTGEWEQAGQIADLLAGRIEPTNRIQRNIRKKIFDLGVKVPESRRQIWRIIRAHRSK